MVATSSVRHRRSGDRLDGTSWRGYGSAIDHGIPPGFNVWQRSMILLDGLTAVFEWFGIRLEKDTGESLDDAFRFLQTQWSLSSFAHASTS